MVNHQSEFNAVIKLSTDDISPLHRQEWLREVIGREYAKANIIAPSKGSLFNEMTIYPWGNLRLSVIRSNSINIERSPKELHSISQDSYFGVILLSGEYMLTQSSREVFLRPGDMAIYDATKPHRIHCPKSFSKLIITIPRKLMRERMAGIEHCTALKINGESGLGAVASNFIQSIAKEADSMRVEAFNQTTEHSLDLLTLALNSVRPENFNLSRSRSLSIYRVKDFVERNLKCPTLDTAMIVSGTGLSARYINELFYDEDMSLMRFVWHRRLEYCHQELINAAHASKRVSDIALSWGFNDFSHFSRAFKQKYGASPRSLRASNNQALYD